MPLFTLSFTGIVLKLKIQLLDISKINMDFKGNFKVGLRSVLVDFLEDKFYQGTSGKTLASSKLF